MLRLWPSFFALGLVVAALSCGSGTPKPTGGAGGGGAAGHPSGGGGAAGTAEQGGRGGGAAGHGDGGVGGAAGLGGRGGGTGGVTTVTSWTQLPCITALLSQCPLQGSCQKRALDGGTDFRACYPSGITVTSMTTSQCNTATTDGVVVYEVRGSDGSVCFSEQRTILATRGCELYHDVFRDADGNIVAQVNDSSRLACTRTGEVCQGTGEFASEECTPTAPAEDCSSGTCP